MSGEVQPSVATYMKGEIRLWWISQDRTNFLWHALKGLWEHVKFIWRCLREGPKGGVRVDRGGTSTGKWRGGGINGSGCVSGCLSGWALCLIATAWPISLLNSVPTWFWCDLAFCSVFMSVWADMICSGTFGKTRGPSRCLGKGRVESGHRYCIGLAHTSVWGVCKYQCVCESHKWSCVHVSLANFSPHELGRRRRIRPSLSVFVSAMRVLLTTLLSVRVCVCIGTSGVHMWAYCQLDVRMGAALVAHIGLGQKEPPGSAGAPHTALAHGTEESPGMATLQFHSL